MTTPGGELLWPVERPLVLGRAGGGADLVVDDPGLSRRHARIWPQAGDLWLEDLGSVNGTWLGEAALREPVRLGPGIEVRLGHCRLTLALEPPSADPLPDGLHLQLEGPPGLNPQLRASSLVASLYAMVELLLRGERAIPEVLTALQGQVAGAERVALVAWPPEAEGGWRTLAGPDAEFVSRSLARYAVERGQALLFSDWAPPADLVVSPSAQVKGIRNAAYVPLTLDGEVLGVLCVDSPQARVPLGAEEFHFICAVAGLLISLLAGERLREEARRRQQEQARREGLMACLRIASHDLANPLHAIRNALSLLRQSPPERHPALLEVLGQASERAQALISTYLDVARLEQGEPLQIQTAWLDPAPLVRQEFELLRATRHELSLEVTSGPLRADEGKLRQILANLLSNAVKFSPAAPRVEVRVTREPGRVRFSVRDHGPGLAQADQARLFQAFRRLGDPSAHPGSGLGLWLVDELVRAHGGRLGCQSEPGKGSLFWFELPQEDAEDGAE